MHYLAVDLGVGAEVTALVVIEARSWEYVRDRRTETEDMVSIEPLFKDPEGKETTECPPPDYQLRHLERFPRGASYPQIVSRVKELRAGLREAVIVLDATGVGKATTDLFARAEIYARIVTVTAADTVVEEDSAYRVPKRELIATAQVVLQTDRLRIARSLPHAELLLRELQGFRMKVPLRSSQETLAWREGPHDDLVLALAVGLWMAETHPDRPLGYAFGKTVFGEQSEDGELGML